VIIKNGPLDKSESDWSLVKHGVPQGSILGPLLFLVHINDLRLIIKYPNSIVNPQTTLFADDISVIQIQYKLSATQIMVYKEKNVKLVFTSVIKWFKANLL
jgi:hypothetical protein